LDWIANDASFTALERELLGPPALTQLGAVQAVLIKPQFEAGEAHLGRGGIAPDAVLHGSVYARIRDWMLEFGWEVTDAVPRPIEGGNGNLKS